MSRVRGVAPVRPGDRIQITGTVKEISDVDTGRQVECDLYIGKSEEEKAVIGRGIATLPGEVS